MQAKWGGESKQDKERKRKVYQIRNSFHLYASCSEDLGTKALIAILDPEGNLGHRSHAWWYKSEWWALESSHYINSRLHVMEKLVSILCFGETFKFIKRVILGTI